MPLGMPMSGGGAGTGKPPATPRGGKPPAPAKPSSLGSGGAFDVTRPGRPGTITADPYEVPGSKPGTFADAIPPNTYAQMYPNTPYPWATNTHGTAIPNDTSPEAGARQSVIDATAYSKNLATQLQQQYAGQQSALDANYATQQGLLGGQYDVNQKNMTDQAGYDQARLDQQKFRDVDSQGQYNNTMSDLARQLNGVDAKDIAARQGFNDQGYNQTLSYIGQRRGFADQGIGEERNYIGSLRGFNDTGQQIGLSQNQLQYDQSHRTTASDAAARGAIGSHGYESNQGELAQQLGLSNQGTRLTHDQTARGLDNRASTSEQGYNSSIAGLDNETAQAGLAHDTTTQGLATAAAKNALSQQQQDALDVRNQQMIDSIAKEYGIRGDQAAAALKAGSDKLGLDYNQAIIQMSTQHQKDTSSLQSAQAQMMTSSIMQAAQGGGTATSSMAQPAATRGSNVRYS